MLKNTKEKITIKNMTIGKRIFLTSGIVLSSLCFSLPVKADSDFNEYAGIYYDVSEKIKGDFDPVFEKFYDTGVVNIDDNSYDIKDLYVKTMEDDKHYLTMAGAKDDLLTSLPISGEQKSTLAFRKTSFLYDIYKDGYITDNTLEIDKEKLQDYLDKWDMKEQSEVMDLKVEQEANKEYHEQYGKKR